eukprot:8048446-Karenia_brevis.AAC.1
MITNTHFKKRFGKRFTHVGTSGAKRQLDYILVTRALWHQVVDAGSISEIDLGSDHKAIKAIVRIKSRRARKRKHQNQKKSFVEKGWAPKDGE